MRRKQIILCILLLFSLTTFAQWGVKAGLDFSSITSSTGKYETGFNIGTAYDIKISRKLYFQPGLLFASNGFKFKTTDYVKKAEVNMYALEIPLIMSFRPNIGDNMKIITDFGFYTRYNLFGKKKYEYSDNTSINESPFDAYNRFDMGLNLGVGVSYSIFSLTGIYQLGLTDSEKGLNGIEHKKIRISLGYLF